MEKIIAYLFIGFLHFQSSANDGAYYARGNHLIPINETDISVTKEILTIKKIRNQFIEVTVYYEFFNPKEEKTILVGFEAESPHGDVDGTPKNGQHPYMHDFTVNLNNTILGYQVAYVDLDQQYVQSGKVISLDKEETEKNIDDGLMVDYVYYFEAKFKKGKNIVKHTYNYNLSNGVAYNYFFNYVLTAANRWANKQIDDFTLIIDMGEFESFQVQSSFFDNASDWLINGIGKTREIDKEDLSYSEFSDKSVRFIMQKGNLVFQKKDFSPKGELYLFSLSQYVLDQGETKSLPFSYYQQDQIPVEKFSKKVLKNLPFARRGYVFSNKELQTYFETKTEWYIPNPNYKPEVEMLTEMEKEWIKNWSE